jgi:hypothetical protein
MAAEGVSGHFFHFSGGGGSGVEKPEIPLKFREKNTFFWGFFDTFGQKFSYSPYVSPDP